MGPTLFLHIPKTAGSSLLESAEAVVGSDAIERDYGFEAAYSSALVKQHIYGTGPIDEYAFHAQFIREKKQWLVGHFHADRYVHLFGAQNTISFVRDPVERVISEYYYLQYKHNLQQPFEEFYRSPSETNKQFRMIGQAPWPAFHLVGSMERYSDCLALLSASRAVSLIENRSNIAKKAPPIISGATRADIKNWNERDCIFVAEVRAYLAAQLSVHAAGRAFCYHDMGFVPDQHIIGWAFYGNQEAPAELGLYINGQLAEKTHATEHRAELQTLKTPRKGHNGFRFDLSSYADAQTVELKALATGQQLLKWQRP